jgi:hypothetical protein
VWCRGCPGGWRLAGAALGAIWGTMAAPDVGLFLLLLLLCCRHVASCGGQVHVDTPPDTCRAWNASRPAADSYNTEV